MTKQYFVLTASFFISFSQALAQTSLPYYSGFDNASEKSGWTEHRLGATGLNKWGYASSMAYSAPESLAHGYPVGGTEQTDDWFVSPEFDFSNGAVIDSLRYAFSGFGTPMAGDTIAIYLLNGSGDPATASSITILYSFTDSTYTGGGVWQKLEGIDIPPVSGQSYLAFRYSTIANWLDVNLDNLSITENSLGLEQTSLNNNSLQIFPNPAGDRLYISWNEEIQKPEFKILALTGQVIKEYSFPLKGNSAQLNIHSLPAAFYLLEYTDGSGKKNVQKFCKEY